MRILRFDKQVLLPIGCLKEALCLDDDAVVQDEVGGVGMCTLRNGVGKLLLLVDLFLLNGFDLCCNAVL